MLQKKKAAKSHLGLAKLPLFLGLVIFEEKVCSSLLIICCCCYFLFQNDLIPDRQEKKREQSVRDNKREISAIISERVKNLKDTNREKKSLKVLRTGNPARRIFTVSNIPEYLSWFRTTSGLKTFGFYK